MSAGNSATKPQIWRACSGIGEALAHRFHDAGNTVIIAGRRLEALEKAAAGRATFVVVPAIEESDDDAPETDVEPKKRSQARLSAKPTPAERRAAATALLRLWRGVARDLALVSTGAVDQIAFPEDRAEIEAVAHRLPPARWGEALRSIDASLNALRRNGNPELLLDAAALSWPAA